jgi:hypothetical protein
MDVQQIYRHLALRPFNPFRIFLNDGTALRVLEPHHAYVENERSIIVGQGLNEFGMPAHSVYFSIDSINRLEPLKEKITTPEEPGSD